MQDTDYENELELLYAVVTQPGHGESVETHLHFLDDKTGSSYKAIPLPEWNEVSICFITQPFWCL